ncbi:5'-methylthioadenosine phosphorylase [Candidatus Woesearchaeota archaeon]|nr:5'-methylthioadenosine phosphorylase [Candidatus Woesearchaeota archaeon]
MGGRPTIAFMLGSGMACCLEEMLGGRESFTERETIAGLRGPYHRGTVSGMNVILVPRHGDRVGCPKDSPAMLVRKRIHEGTMFQLSLLGTEAIFSFCAVGSIDRDVPLADTGTFIIPDDYMRGFGRSEITMGEEAKVIHPNMSAPYDARLRKMSTDAILHCGYSPIRAGLYIDNIGDQFETRTEILVLDRLTKGIGNRLVGMTAVPETVLAAQMRIPYCLICSNVNYAEGLDASTPVNHDQTLSVMEKARPMAIEVVKRIISEYTSQ